MLREKTGKPVAARITAPRLALRLRKLRAYVTSAAARRRIEKLAAELRDDERKALAGEVASLSQWLVDLGRLLRQR